MLLWTGADCVRVDSLFDVVENGELLLQEVFVEGLSDPEKDLNEESSKRQRKSQPMPTGTMRKFVPILQCREKRRSPTKSNEQGIITCPPPNRGEEKNHFSVAECPRMRTQSYGKRKNTL